MSNKTENQRVSTGDFVRVKPIDEYLRKKWNNRSFHLSVEQAQEWQARGLVKILTPEEFKKEENESYE